MVNKKKPLGILVFGILGIILSLFSLGLLFLSFILFLAASVGGLSTIETASQFVYGIFTMLVEFVIAVTLLIASIGIIFLKRWAHRTLLILAVLALGFGLVDLVIVAFLFDIVTIIMGIFGYII